VLADGGQLFAPFGDELVVVGRIGHGEAGRGIDAILGAAARTARRARGRAAKIGRFAAPVRCPRDSSRRAPTDLFRPMDSHATPAPWPISGRKIRFALVGCGRISKNHFEAIAKHAERAELVAVCDTDPTALANAVKATGAAGHASLRQLLAGSDADIVVLATPSGLHSQQAIACAGAGRHVLSEKPMATKFEDGQAMVRACRDAGVKLFVVKQNRLNSTVQLVKRALENAQVSVTHAARSLGISYQALGYMLETRHKALMTERTPMRRRMRRVLTK